MAVLTDFGKSEPMPDSFINAPSVPSEEVVARLTIIIESAPTAIVMVDETGTIVLVNREVEVLFGYSRTELLGKSVEILVPERYRESHPARRQEFSGNPHARKMGAGRDLFGLRKNGSEFPVEIGLRPVKTDKGVFVLSAIVDITERKRMEDALRNMNEELERRVKERTAELARSNEAMERSNIELQQFAYIASHDLQAPLRSISGFVQMLQKDYAGKIDGKADEWIRRTVENTHYMQTLIQDLLSYSQIDSRARPFTEVDFSEVFRETLSILEGSIVDAKADVTQGELPTVIGDKSQLVQLLVNLVANGIKYHGEATPRVHVSAAKSGAEWVFSVRDNGIGIAPKHHEKIFEIFRRLHTRHTYPGTGIGLAVCRRVAQRHEGRIWVESEAGQGSTFHFSIPERKAKAG